MNFNVFRLFNTQHRNVEKTTNEFSNNHSNSIKSNQHRDKYE